MRWVTIRNGDLERPALVDGDQAYLLAGGEQLIELLGDDGERLASAGERARNDPMDVVALAESDLAPPLRPPQIRDFLTFLDHLRNARGAANMQINETWLEIPGFYFSNVAAVVGPFDPVPIAPGCEQFDFELEVAAVIGRAGSNLHPDEADDHIVGFTIFNDWSGRDLQIYEMQLGLGPTKGKDSANTLGPMLVTKDELEPFRRGNSYHLEMTAWVNDDEIGHGYMDQMDWSWGEMIAYASRGTRLLTGEVIGSGTVPTGCLFEHFAAGADDFRGFLKPGDIVTFEVEQLGRLRQLVTESLPVHRLSTGF